MIGVERVYIKKRDKNYIRISGLEKGEVWSTIENNKISIFILEDKFEDIKNAEIIDRTTRKADKISELEERIGKIEQTLKEIKQLLDRKGTRKS